MLSAAIDWTQFEGHMKDIWIEWHVIQIANFRRTKLFEWLCTYICSNKKKMIAKTKFNINFWWNFLDLSVWQSVLQLQGLGQICTCNRRIFKSKVICNTVLNKWNHSGSLILWKLKLWKWKWNLKPLRHFHSLKMEMIGNEKCKLKPLRHFHSLKMEMIESEHGNWNLSDTLTLWKWNDWKWKLKPLRPWA